MKCSPGTGYHEVDVTTIGAETPRPRFRRALSLVFCAAGMLGCDRPPTPPSAPSTPSTAPTGLAPAPAVAPLGPSAPEPGRIIPLWPEGVPERLADAPPERVEDGRVYHVSDPTLTAFPANGSGKNSAVIVCPGGGYVRLAVEKEGSDITRFLNGLGVSAFVLKYRVAPYRYPAALRDVVRAVRYVRANAADLGVDPQRIGVFGSSAGGHVAASAATLFDAPDAKTGAALDAVSGRPDFVALLYPVITMQAPHAHAGSRDVLFGPEPTSAMLAQGSLELHVTSATPPAFLVHTADDRSVPVENSLLFYRALRTAGVPAELHLYERGGHGFGMKRDLGPTSLWPERLADWMRLHGLVAQQAGQ